MRARELLLEYRRDITAQNYGDAIVKKLATPRPEILNPALHGYAQLVRYLKNPTYYLAVSFRIETPHGSIVVEPSRAEEIAQNLRPVMIQDTLSVIEGYDPTPNKEYTVWLLRRWLTDPDQQAMRMEDYNRNNVLGAYHMGKRRNMIKPEHRDINRFRTYREFENTMYNEYDIDKLLGVIDKPEETDRGTYKEVYRDDSVRVIVPRDKKAACFWGRGTRWCTAATRGPNYFDQYNEEGPLYILLPKDKQYTGEKYQIHFPSGQYMNPEDNTVSLDGLRKRFSGFFSWVIKNDSQASDLLPFTDKEIVESVWKAVAKVGIKLAKKFYKEKFYNEDEYTNTIQNIKTVAQLSADRIVRYSEQATANVGEGFTNIYNIPALFNYVVEEDAPHEVGLFEFPDIFVIEGDKISERRLQHGKIWVPVEKIDKWTIGYVKGA